MVRRRPILFPCINGVSADTVVSFVTTVPRSIFVSPAEAVVGVELRSIGRSRSTEAIAPSSISLRQRHPSQLALGQLVPLQELCRWAG